MGVPVSQMWTVASYVFEAEAGGAQAVSARADAGAAVSLQPGLRGLRQDPVPGPLLKKQLTPEQCFQRRRRVRRPDGVASPAASR